MMLFMNDCKGESLFLHIDNYFIGQTEKHLTSQDSNNNRKVILQVFYRLNGLPIYRIQIYKMIKAVNHPI